MYRDYFPNKGCSQNSSVNIENNRTVKPPLPPITLEVFENNSSDLYAYFTFKKSFLNALACIPTLTIAQKLTYLKDFVRGEILTLSCPYDILVGPTSNGSLLRIAIQRTGTPNVYFSFKYFK